MNKIYKTVWNAVRQQFVVADEAQNTRGKPAKAAVALTVVAAALCSTMASAAYVEPGFVANSRLQMDEAKASWETDEYMKNWGLVAQKASAAYALGFHGQGVKVGMMDSGFLKNHVELSGDRWHAVSAYGTYDHNGERYPQYAYGKKPKDTSKFTAGSSFAVNGYYDSSVNDNHGTGCVGVMAGNRNGTGMHGVAWGSEIYSANTGGTDDTNYGPFPDYNFFKAGYDALVNSGVKIINNSFGTNLKQVDEKGNILDYYHSGPELTTVNDIEYEYFMFKRAYAGKKSFVDAAWDAIKGKDVIQVFTNGNNDRANPYHRALFPYFTPEAEKQWIAIAGLRQNDKKTDPYKYKLEAYFNEAGFAKYWTLVGPGQNGYTSNISGAYGGYSGTSMAAPFVSGAFAVLASRYTDMTAVQVREVLLTTANHKNSDGTNMTGWDNVNGTTPQEGEVSDRMGWGVPDLEKGMYGPAQFFNGNFNYTLNSKDIWTNDISQVALDQRHADDIAWLKSVTKDGTPDGEIVVSNNPNDYKLTNTSNGSANADGKKHNYDLAGIANKDVTLEEAKAWRLEYYQRRAEAIRAKIASGDYNGSLTKSGTGTLVMTGNNSYKGATTVKEGTLLAFSESIGTDNKVTVEKNGTFGVLSTYNDTFTQKGQLTSKGQEKIAIDIKEGGSLYIDAGSQVSVGAVTGLKNIVVGMAGVDKSDLTSLYYGDKAKAGTANVTGTFTADSGLDGITVKNIVGSDSAFFGVSESGFSNASNKLTVTMSKKEGVTFADFGTNANTRSIGRALEGSRNDLVKQILGMSESEVQATYNKLDDDFYASARNGLVMNSLAVSRTVIDQARGMGEGRAVEMENGMGRIWATGIGHWGTSDGNKFDTDVDFRAGFIGGEFVAHETTKVGAYFGYGSSDYKANANKIDADNVHFGVYGMSDVGPASITYGFAYTTEDRDTERSLGGFMSAHSEDASVMQLFAEAAYTGFDLGENKIQPYFGVSWAKVKTDSVADQYDQSTMTTDEIDDNIGIASVGVRAALPFMMGTMPVAVKADAGYSHFFGDTEGVTRLQLGKNGGWAEIEGSELKGLFNVGLGVTAQVAKSATVGINYGASLGSDQKTHGINATLRIAF